MSGLCVEENTYIVTREWGLKSIIGLHRKKLLKCSMPHCFLSNFQGENFEKVKLNGGGVLLLSNHIHDQLAFDKRS
jgi:hypothetical protein